MLRLPNAAERTPARAPIRSIRWFLVVVPVLAATLRVEAQPLWSAVTGKSDLSCADGTAPSMVATACVSVDWSAVSRLGDAAVGHVFVPDASGRRFRLDRVERRTDGVSVFAVDEADPLARFQLTVVGSVANAWYGEGSQTWEVRPARDGLYAVYRVVETDRPAADYLVPEALGEPFTGVGDEAASVAEPPLPSIAAASPAAHEITALVAYTSVVKTRLGVSGLATRVQAYQDWLNQAFANSGHPEITIRVIGTVETVYTPAASMSTDVERLQDTADGFLDDLPPQRVSAGADLLHLLLPDQSDACGVAYMPHDLRPDLGVGVSAVSCSLSTFAHEIGHNFGMGHDTYVSTSDQYWSWAYGYVDPEYRFRTIMAYANRCVDAGRTCPEIQYYSDPDRSYQGYPIGIPFAQGVRTADNVRVLEDMVADIDDYSRYLHPACDWTIRSISVPSVISGSTQATFRATLEAGSSACALERVRLEFAAGTTSSSPTTPIGTHEISAAAGQQVQVSTPFTVTSAGLAAGTYQARVLIVRRGYYWYINNVSVTSGVAVEGQELPRDGLRVSPPWPNPASEQVRIALSADRTQVVPVSVFDAVGRLVRMSETVVPAGSTVEWRVDAGALPVGVYFIRAGIAGRALPFSVTR